ncbi:MAG TPA: glycosyl hydrolase family 18 protein [Pseudonocardiaceae bacterium]|jgi:spore germination protein YaaH|nr:glycosyl hydrolase family 18 protein [Pseudonocardiaceae bacterium]
MSTSIVRTGSHRLGGASPGANTAGNSRAGHESAPGQQSRRRGALTGSVFLILLVVGAVLVVSPRMFMPGPAPSTLVVGSLPFWNLTEGPNVVVANRGSFNEVSPWIYGIAGNGQIVAQVPERAAETAAGMDQLRRSGIPLVPTIANVTNGRWAYEPVANMLHDPAAMEQHVTDIVALVQREGYAGIDIDYEDLRATDREAFTTFATRLSEALHAHDKVLSIALFAKTSDAGEDQRNVAQDYAAIGQAVDEVRLMAYDYHWSASGPGPVAPITWVHQVLDYAKTQIPANKIVLGVPVSGFDWVDGKGEPVSWLQCFGRTRAFNATLEYDRLSQSPSFKYTDAQGRAHEVWFENAESTTAKLETAKTAGIRGVYLWMIGGEDDRTWAQLHQILPVETTQTPGTDKAPR